MVAHKERILVNKVIMFLTLSDIFTWGISAILGGLAGIYLAGKLKMNTAEIVGIGLSINFLTRAAFQIPIGIITDKIKKDTDDILFLLVGNILLGVPYLFYPFITSPSLFYFLQFLFGLGTALNLVSWRKLFAKNLDKNKEGIEYAVYDSVLSISIAAFGVIAGVIANINQMYFDLVMVGSGLLMLTSGIWVTSIFFVRNRRSNQK